MRNNPRPVDHRAVDTDDRRLTQTVEPDEPSTRRPRPSLVPGPYHLTPAGHHALEVAR